MNVDNLDISTNTGDVIIKGSKINQLDITTSIGDISVDSNYIGNIKTNSDIGDIKVISSTNNVNCKSLEMKKLLN